MPSSSRTTDLAEFYKSAGREQMRAAIRAWVNGVRAELEKELDATTIPHPDDPAFASVQQDRAELRGGIGILTVLIQVLDQQSDAPQV